MWRLIYAIPSWLIFIFLVFLPLLLLGFIMVPIAAVFGAYKKTDNNLGKPKDGPIYHFTWPFMWVWDNYEDGIANRNYKQFSSMFMQICYWSCIRNPVNNLRIVPFLSCKIDPEKVFFIGSFSSQVPDKKIYDCFYRLGNKEAAIEWSAQTKKYDTKIPQWFFAWQGFYSNFYWQFKAFGGLWRLWVGFKVFPTDIYGVTEYRKFGAGFAQQFKRVLKYE